MTYKPVSCRYFDHVEFLAQNMAIVKIKYIIKNEEILTLESFENIYPKENLD